MMRNGNSELDLPAAKIIEQSDVSLLNPLECVPEPPAVIRNNVICEMEKTAGFERRFLSARGKSANLCLEVAVIWRDTVLSIQQFKAGHAEISVGSDKNCTYHVDNHTANGKVCLAQYVNNHWEILFNHAFEGFILKGGKKTEFASANKADFAIPSSNSSLMPDSLACTVDGDVRAKFVFGEVSILIHYVDAVAFPIPLLGGFKITDYIPLAISIVLHLIIFSFIFLATDLVNTLIVDRIIASSRFVTELDISGNMFKPDVPDEPELPVEPELPDPGLVSESNDCGCYVDRDMGYYLRNRINRAEDYSFLKDSPLMRAMIPVESNMFDFIRYHVYIINFPDNIQADPIVGSNMFDFDSIRNLVDINKFTDGTQVDVFPRHPPTSATKKGVRTISLKPGIAQVNGSIDSRLIRKIVRDHNSEVLKCYSEHQLIKPKDFFNGRIVVNWLINPQGGVSKVSVKETTMITKKVECCIQNSIKNWKFPVPKNGGTVMVEYPFVFEISDGN